MNKKSLIIGALALSFLVAGAFGASVALADSNKGVGLYRKSNTALKNSNNEADKSAWQAKHDAVTKALEAGDYNAWVLAKKAIDPNCPMLTKINASNFSQLVKAHKLHMEANQIMKDLGVEMGESKHQGMGKGKGMGQAKGSGPGGSCHMIQK